MYHLHKGNENLKALYRNCWCWGRGQRKTRRMSVKLSYHNVL